MMYDVCAAKHGGSETSRIANSRIDSRKNDYRQAIWKYVKACGPLGATSHEVAQSLGICLQTVSARLAEMEYGKGGSPVLVGRRGVRGGCAVRVALKYLEVQQ